jgi:hypothetical protein
MPGISGSSSTVAICSTRPFKGSMAGSLDGPGEYAARLQALQKPLEAMFVIDPEVQGIPVTTNDEGSYGFYVFPALHLVWQRCRAVSDQAPGGLGRLARDGRLWLAASRAVVVFVAGQNLVFNVDGFVAHVALMLGEASQDYQRWEGTVGGPLAVAWAALGSSRGRSGGRRCSCASLASPIDPRAGSSFRCCRPCRTTSVSSAWCCITTTGSFWASVWCWPCSVGRGWRLSSRRHGATGWRQAGVAGVLLASFFRGALVDVMLVNEARYVVER